MLDWGRGYLTASGHVNADKLCWLFQRLGAEEEATFQQREVREEGRREGWQKGAGATYCLRYVLPARQVGQRGRAAQHDLPPLPPAALRVLDSNLNTPNSPWLWQLRKVREQRRKLQQEAAGGENGRGHGPRGGAGWMRGGEWVSVGELRAGCSLDEALAGAGSGGWGRGWPGEARRRRMPASAAARDSPCSAAPTAIARCCAAGDGPGLPAAALWADDPARLRRELLKRVRARMDDRAQAGMAADQVRRPAHAWQAADPWLAADSWSKPTCSGRCPPRPVLRLRPAPKRLPKATAPQALPAMAGTARCASLPLPLATAAAPRRPLQVRLSLPGYRARYYQRCFGAEAAGGPELEKMVGGWRADWWWGGGGRWGGGGGWRPVWPWQSKRA